MPFTKYKSKDGLVYQFLIFSAKGLLLLIVSFFVLQKLTDFFVNFYFSNLLPNENHSLVFFSLKHKIKDIALFFNLLLCFFIYVILIFLFIKKKLKLLHYLIDSIHLMKGGDMEQRIYIEGNDELSHLALHIDELRGNFLKNQQQEEQRAQAHNNFLTAISHDLRTPLTSLLGYLEILSDDDFLEKKKKKRYFELCISRAMQLNDLVNTAFEYFYITDKEFDSIELLRCNSVKSLISIIEERLYILKSNGFEYQTILSNCKVALVYDIRLVERVFDNIFMNIIRYGDRKCKILIDMQIEKEKLIIKIENQIQINNKTNSCVSTGIGIKNCKKIMKLHKGEFSTYSNDIQYITKIVFPIKNKS